ncbi:hypothetical protein [Gandjariella thermophila]|nr:hypothetical protein [Gandjariella thermophila]
MTPFRRFVASAVALFGILGGTLLAGPAAQAEPFASTAVAAAPSCATVRHTVGTVTQTVYVTNHCPHSVSFRVRIALHQDSPCYIVQPGHTRSVKWSRFQAFQGISWNCA